LTLLEAIQLFDEFTLEGILAVYVQPNPKDPAFDELTDQFERVLETGHSICLAPDPAPGFRYAYELNIITLDASPRGACPKTTANNRCGIYEKRPTICHTAPVCPTVSMPRNQFDIVTHIKRHHPCDWSTNAPLLISNGKIVNEDVAKNYRKFRSDQRHNGVIIENTFEESELTNYAHLALTSPGQLQHIPIDINTIMLTIYQLRRTAAQKASNQRTESEKFWLDVAMPSPENYFRTQQALMKKLVITYSANPQLQPDDDPSVMIRALNYLVMLNGLVDIAKNTPLDVG